MPNKVPEKIKLEIEKISKNTSKDIYVYYGSLDSAKAEINKEDALFIEHKNKSYSATNKEALLFLHTSGGFLEPAITMIDHLRRFYNGKVSIVVLEKAYSAGTFLALSADKLYISNKAGFSDFNPVDGIRNKTPEEFKTFISQFSDTVFKYIGDGILAYRSPDEAWSIVNNISPFLGRLDHNKLSAQDIIDQIDEVKLVDQIPNTTEEGLEGFHHLILDEMKTLSLSKLLIIDGQALKD